MNKYIKLALVGFIIYALFNLFKTIKLSEVIMLIRELPSFWPLFLVFAVLSNIFATIAWRSLDHYGALQKTNFFELFLLRQAGETLGQLNPTGAVGGDFLKYNILSQKHVNKEEISESLILFRMYSIVSFFVVIAVILSIIFFRFSKEGSWIEILIVALILILILISFKTMKKIPTFLGKLVAFLKNKLNLSFLDSIQNGLDKLSTTFLTLKFETRHLTAIFFLVLHWFAGGMEVFAIFYLLGESIWVVNAFFIDFGVMIFKSLGQFIPGQAGIEELGNSYMLKVVGLKSSAFWLSFTILRRLRMMFFVVQSLLYMAYHKWSNHRKPIAS